MVRLAGGARVRAMVVDDVHENRVVLCEMLSSVGCEVCACDSGAEALRQVTGFRPEIAFIDMMMPGMDGFETARMLAARSGRSELRQVATTASALTHEQRQFREAGFADVLVKPLSCERVFLSITTLLGVDFEPGAPSADRLGTISAGSLDDVAGRNRSHPDKKLRAAGDGEELPDGIRVRLREAAEMYSITGLKEILAEIDRLGPHGSPMATHVRQLMRRYDLESIARFATSSTGFVDAAQA